MDQEITIWAALIAIWIAIGLCWAAERLITKWRDWRWMIEQSRLNDCKPGAFMMNEEDTE